MARERIGEFVQTLLEEEVTALVGHRKSERRSDVEARLGSTVTTCSTSRASASARSPCSGPESEAWKRKPGSSAFRRRTWEVGKLLPELYLHGLA